MKIAFGDVKLNDNTFHKYQFCAINHEIIILKLLIQIMVNYGYKIYSFSMYRY